MIRPQLVVVNVSLQVTGPATAAAAAVAAIGALIAGLPIGGWVIVSKLIQAAHESDLGVARVGIVAINGVAGDLAMGGYARAVPGSVMVQP